MTGNFPASAGVSARLEERRAAAAEESATPWYVWCVVAAVTSALLGAHWDIAWHRSIGRDTFWTPAHVMIYLCGVLAGIACGYLILATTFGSDERARAASVKMWGFRGPLGAFIASWGGVAMLTSAPFDDWWHNAYGLDTKVLSPPHVLLITGVLAVQTGALILILGRLNRAEGGARRRLDRLLLYTGGMILSVMYILVVEYLFAFQMHSAVFYRAAALAFPVVLAGIGSASDSRWAATALAGVYTALQLAMLWILPLVPAEPKLGPVYQKITHLIPMAFPLLLIVPAAAMDLLRPRLAGMGRWRAAAVLGVVYLGLLAAVQWPFANFLLSPGARNAFFGADYFSYDLPPAAAAARHVFTAWEKSRGEFWTGMAIALVSAVLTMRVGLTWGGWMRRVRR
jgi:hypothetical protein